MKNSTRLELRKDICTPNKYERAGTIKTFKEWKQLLGPINEYAIDEWFIDITISKEAEPVEKIDQIIKRAFKKRGLHSLTYWDACREVARKYHQFMIQNKEVK